MTGEQQLLRKHWPLSIRMLASLCHPPLDLEPEDLRNRRPRPLNNPCTVVIFDPTNKPPHFIVFLHVTRFYPNLYLIADSLVVLLIADNFVRR